ncbi:MAG: hypothetical protein GY820_03290 [Gammaproteobacteria bacterium]|nr:hypothetical protein [Gammaproteobacteria bacterium]
MDNTSFKPGSNRAACAGLIFFGLIVFGLPGCGGGGGSGNTVTADVAGNYTGSASVKMADNSTALEIADLRAFVYGSRIMAMGLLDNAASFVLYDIQISSISGSSYEAVATVYKAAEYLATANVSGNITAGVSLSGTFAGSGIANGTFSVAADEFANAGAAGLDVIGGASYKGPLNTGSSDLAFDIDADGNVESTATPINAIKMTGCALVADSKLTPIAGENLYDLVFVLSGCDDSTVNGTYTGLVTIFDNTNPSEPSVNGIMPAAFSNGEYSGTAIFGVN